MKDETRSPNWGRVRSDLAGYGVPAGSLDAVLRYLSGLTDAVGYTARKDEREAVVEWLDGLLSGPREARELAQAVRDGEHHGGA